MVLQANNITDRNVWVADSFEGLPAPNLEQYQKITVIIYIRLLTRLFRTSTREFQKYDLLNDQVKFLKGWFKDTLPTAPIEK